MEPDLEQLLDDAAGGGPFPQFGSSWSRVYAASVAACEPLRASPSASPTRVALATADPLWFTALFVALCRRRIDLFLFNPAWGPREWDAALQIARPQWIVGAEGGGADARVSLRDEAVEDATSEGEGEGFRVMIPTGGTTGGIRFATHDWSTLKAACSGFGRGFGCERIASHCILPLYHVSGFMQLVRGLLTQGTVVFGSLNPFEQGHRLLLESAPKNRFLSLVATQLERLLSREPAPGWLREYQAVFVGGGPAPQELLQRSRELRLPLAPTYGMTETAAQVATQQPQRFLQGDSTVGQPLPHAAIEIVSEADPSRILPRGQEGLIRIEAASLFTGYYGQGARPPGPLVTADVGKLLPDGRLLVLRRADRTIISGGEKIVLQEVEQCLQRSGLVLEVVAFGLPDRDWGEKLAVAYVPRGDAVTEAVLKATVAGELVSFKRPKVWLRCAAIPRSEAGKPLIHQLQRESET